MPRIIWYTALGFSLALVTDPAATADFPIANALTTLRIGTNQTRSNYCSGHLAELKFRRDRKPDGCLQSFAPTRKGYGEIRCAVRLAATDFSSNYVLYPEENPRPVNPGFHPESWFQRLDIGNLNLLGECFCSKDEPLSNYIQTDIVTEDGVDAFYQEVTAIDDTNSITTRNQYIWPLPNQGTTYRQEYYVKVRIKLQPNLLALLTPANGWWRSFFTFHNTTNLTLKVHEYAGVLKWVLQKQANDPTPMEIWHVDGSQLVPLDEWFDLEWWARPETSDGAGDGKVVVAVNGVSNIVRTTDLFFTSTGFATTKFLQVYMDEVSIDVGPGYQWTSSIEFWHGWPVPPIE